MSSTGANKRRVSFRNVRTVKEFDEDASDDMEHIAKDEPIKLGDTGSSDGVVSHSVVLAEGSLSRRRSIAEGDAEGTDFTLYHKTLECFMPKNTSTPMPAFGRTVLAVGECADVSYLDVAMHSGTACNVERHQMSVAESTFGPDATRRLFTASGAGHVINCAEMVDSCMDEQPMEMCTPSSIDLTSDATEAVFAKPPGSNAFGSKQDQNMEKEESELDVVVAANVLEASKSVTSVSGDVVLQVSGTKHSLSRPGHSSHIVDCSPQAVLKKKLRIESPLTRNVPMIILGQQALENAMNESVVLDNTTHEKTDRSFSRSLYNPHENSPLDISLNQSLAKFRRRVRRSLDKTSAWPSLSYTGSPLMLRDIAEPEGLYTSSLPSGDNMLQANNTTYGDVTPKRNTLTFYSSYGGEGRSRVLEPAASFSVLAVNENEDISLKDSSQRSQSSLSSLCDVLDFDINIGLLSCYDENADDGQEAANLKREAREIVAGLLAFDSSQHTVEEAILKIGRTRKMLADAICTFNPRKLSQREAAIFSVCRLEAQNSWYEQRLEIAKKILTTAQDFVEMRKSQADEKLRQMKVVELRGSNHGDVFDLESRLSRLRNLRNLIPRIESVNNDLMSAEDAVRQQRRENWQKELSTSTKQIEEICNETKRLRIETAQIMDEMAHKRSKRIEAIRLYDQKKAQLLAKIDAEMP